MSHPIRSGTLGLALGFVLVLAACDRAPDAVAPADPAAAGAELTSAHERIGPGVLEAARTGSGAAIVVALDIPARSALAAERRAGLAELRREVAAVQEAVLQAAGGDELRVKRRYVAVPAFSATARSEAALLRLAANPRVRRVDLDVGGTGELAASVSHIGADRRRAAGNTGEGVVVAVFDTGLDTDHPDLAGDVRAQACFGRTNSAVEGVGFCPDRTDRQTGPGAAEDDAGHGTHVSGIITSDGTVSAPGVAPGADIVAVKVLDNCSFSGCFYAFSEIVAALDYVIANNATLGVRLINMSLGTSARFAGDCDNSTAFNMAGAAAVNTLRSIGVVTFASAGNNSSGTTMQSPACLSNVISVGAADNADNVALFSNSNATTDLFAPGVRVVSLARGGGTTTASGTSMASPHAAGCAALLIQAGDATTPDAIEARLETSPAQVTDPKNGLTFPRLDCAPAERTEPMTEPMLVVDSHSGLCLDVADTGREPGTGMIVWNCHGYVNQRFLVPVLGETGEIRVYDDMCLDATGASSDDGTRVIIWPCHGGANQQWTRTAAGEFRGIGGKCLDVFSARKENRTPVIIWTCHGEANQQWDVRPAATVLAAR